MREIMRLQYTHTRTNKWIRQHKATKIRSSWCWFRTFESCNLTAGYSRDKDRHCWQPQNETHFNATRLDFNVAGSQSEINFFLFPSV